MSNQNMPLYSCAIELKTGNDKQLFTKWKGALKEREKQGEGDFWEDVRARRLRKLSIPGKYLLFYKRLCCREFSGFL